MFRMTLRATSVLLSAMIAGAIALNAPAASASDSYNDYFDIYTSDHDSCGEATFVDYGSGLPGGGMNDDYVEIRDTCDDHHGVKAWAWLTRDGHKYYLGGAYDGYGSIYTSRAYVVWDPFKPYGNVLPGDYVGLKVCLVDGANDSTPTKCYSETHRSVDG